MLHKISNFQIHLIKILLCKMEFFFILSKYYSVRWIFFHLIKILLCKMDNFSILQASYNPSYILQSRDTQAFLLQYYIYFHQTNLIFGLLSKQSIFENYTHTSVCPLRDHSLLLKKQAAEAMVGMQFSQGLPLCRCSAEWTKKGLRQLKQGPPPPRCDAIPCHPWPQPRLS